MNYKSSIIYAWGFFLGILFLELGVDYLLRISSDDFRYSGIPETIWFLVHIIAAIIAGYFITSGVKYLKNTYLKIIHLVVNFIIGSFLYIVITGLYILGLGIDSL
ncbi:MAG: hypothetical protein L3K25_16170 [Gammaproteobacteria bacterium]|nr:hypothetical protein [Gammaproteobacteria bacterium]